MLVFKSDAPKSFHQRCSVWFFDARKILCPAAGFTRTRAGETRVSSPRWHAFTAYFGDTTHVPHHERWTTSRLSCEPLVDETHRCHWTVQFLPVHLFFFLFLAGNRIRSFTFYATNFFCKSGILSGKNQTLFWKDVSIVSYATSWGETSHNYFNSAASSKRKHDEIFWSKNETKKARRRKKHTFWTTCHLRVTRFLEIKLITRISLGSQSDRDTHTHTYRDIDDRSRPIFGIGPRWLIYFEDWFCALLACSARTVQKYNFESLGIPRGNAIFKINRGIIRTRANDLINVGVNVQAIDDI